MCGRTGGRCFVPVATHSFTLGAHTPMKRLLKLSLQKPELAALLLLLILVGVFQITSNGFFLSYANMRGLLGFLPEMALVAVGVTLLMICGEFDLSVGSVFALETR